MVVVPLAQPEMEVMVKRDVCESEGPNWVRIAAGGSLLAGGLLLLTGKVRAGLATAAAGTVLAAFDQQETIKMLWNSMPGYIDQAQRLLGKVEETVAEVAAQRDRLHEILTK
ncbi:MAG: hypothetical protein ABSF53_09325 [Terracidiphilus sp.]